MSDCRRASRHSPSLLGTRLGRRTSCARCDDPEAAFRAHAGAVRRNATRLITPWPRPGSGHSGGPNGNLIREPGRVAGWLQAPADSALRGRCAQANRPLDATPYGERPQLADQAVPRACAATLLRLAHEQLQGPRDVGSAIGLPVAALGPVPAPRGRLVLVPTRFVGSRDPRRQRRR